MVNFITKVWKFIIPKTERQHLDAYLAKSVDLADLERRLKRTQNSNMSGWS